MWGSIARMVVRPEVPEAYLLAQLNAFQSRPGGLVSGGIYRSASDPLEVWLVAMFEDEESYRNNAESRVQHAEYLTLRAFLQQDPEWHDVSEILSFAGEA